MNVGVVSETLAGEQRVALAPAAVAALAKAGMSVMVQAGAGERSGFSDHDYASKGATIVSADQLHGDAEVICCVRVGSDVRYRENQTVLGLADPLGNPERARQIAETGVRLFALELLPRITRAQAMDVLSSQATLAGYKAVLLAASHLTRMVPMMMTAAGTIPAAKFFVVGAGVAGLQAIASARRLGAVVTGYDIRPVVKEQIESLGAKFLHIPLSSAQAEGQGGYAKAMDEEFYKRQRDMMADAVSQSDAVITTAAIPGKPPPLLVTADAVSRMKTGSVVVDLAARPGQSGGNCELTQPDQVVSVAHGVSVLGPTNLPSALPQTASSLFSRNVTTFLTHLVKDGSLRIDTNDEITRETMVCEHGSITNERVRQVLAANREGGA